MATWTPERRAAASAAAKARVAKQKAEITANTPTDPTDWTPEQLEAAAKAKRERIAAEAVSGRQRVPYGKETRDILRVKDTPADAHDHWVNVEKPGRLDDLKQRGYEFVTDSGTTVGDRQIDNSNVGSVVTRNVGGRTDYLMRQHKDWYLEDQKAKQREVDETEESFRRSKDNNRGDGYVGEVKIG